MNRVKIEYSIVSRGTEIYNNHGYMGISSIVDCKRYILNVNHNVKESVINSGYLMVNSKYNIENIVFSRFQLITALTFEKIKASIPDGILIYGLGNIGISCLFYLLDNNYKNITVCIKKQSKRIVALLRIIRAYYNVNVNFVESTRSYEEFKTYIDTTGSSKVIESIFNNSNFNNNIIILSTPREDDYLISPLLINRKNLTIIGGHELNGVTNEQRQLVLEKLLKSNNNKTFLNEFINVYDYSLKKLKEIKNQKSNFIEIFKH